MNYKKNTIDEIDEENLNEVSVLEENYQKDHRDQKINEDDGN